jgi:2-dehydro-3-deoxygluconokinase
LIYLTGISLAILPTKDRSTLISLLRQFADRGVAIAFDSNYRAALWPSADSARSIMAELAPLSQLLFLTLADEQRLWGDNTAHATLARLSVGKTQCVVIKLGSDGCLCSHGTTVTHIAANPVADVVDTTAAGDAFNAGFLAAWLSSRSPEECCQAGNVLAGAVIRHRGAILPVSATPSFRELLS